MVCIMHTPTKPHKRHQLQEPRQCCHQQQQPQRQHHRHQHFLPFPPPRTRFSNTSPTATSTSYASPYLVGVVEVFLSPTRRFVGPAHSASQPEDPLVATSPLLHPSHVGKQILRLVVLGFRYKYCQSLGLLSTDAATTPQQLESM